MTAYHVAESIVKRREQFNISVLGGLFGGGGGVGGGVAFKKGKSKKKQ